MENLQFLNDKLQVTNEISLRRDVVLLVQKKVQQVILLPDKYYVLIFMSTYAYKGALE